MYISGPNIFLSYSSNKFRSNSDDIITSLISIPSDIDTSFPLKFVLMYIGDSNIQGNVFLKIQGICIQNGTHLYLNSSDSNSSSPHIIQDISISSVSSKNTLHSSFLSLDISNINPRPSNNNYPFLLISFQRISSHISDTYQGNIYLTQFKSSYINWCSDDHILL